MAKRKSTGTEVPPAQKSVPPAAATASAAGGDQVPRGPLSETPSTVQPAQAYVVLARKYRPETFADLIGQDAMVTTLKNAFAADRLAHGYMLTGVRGVGKTTTARILARALNYTKPGVPGRPTIEMDGYGVHCLEIMQSRHPDVLEMDAASNTGVDNIRELTESARYKPISARYRVFIIDEVHMLSKGAFNALLKTLEEPPEHVKFIFATTEARKVPVTVLSRCQRFDLRRVDVPELVQHFRKIVTAEGASADDEALRLIARAAEGSVRDGLSLLDQGIAMGAGTVTAAGVRAMLGLADRGRIFDLAEQLFRGAAGAAIEVLGGLHRDGAEPAQALADLAEAVHAATRLKVAGAGSGLEGLSAEELRRARALADRLSIAILARAWQMLLKGLDEAARAPDSLAAAEMVLIRIAHTADLPSPDEVVRALAGGGVQARQGARADGNGAPQSQPPAAPEAAAQAVLASVASAPGAAPRQPSSFDDVIALASAERDAKLKVHLEEDVSLVRFEPGRLEVCLLPGAPAGLANELSEKLTRWTGRRWMVVLSRVAGERPRGETRRQRRAEEIAGLRAHPAVAALLEEFPEAEIADVRPLRRGAGDDGAGG